VSAELVVSSERSIMYQFKKYLFDAYGGFGDKRVKDITKDYSFKLDDQDSSDNHALFCGIFAKVIEGDVFELSLSNNAPINSKIKSIVKSKKGDIQEGQFSSIRITLTSKDYNFVSELANAIGELVAKGKKYSNPNWKWLCPRTAKSLKRFSEVLKAYKGKNKAKVRKGFFDI
jgi:hypothetical protein